MKSEICKILDEILEIDVKQFDDNFTLKEQLFNARVLITGATGLIGSTLVRCLVAMNCGIKITVPVRNREKASKLFVGCKGLRILQCELIEYCNHITEKFDYIIHCASPTNGKYITEHPVETYELITETTVALLRYAKSNGIKGMVYVSSLEYYGENSDDRWIKENYLGYLDLSKSRSAYPMAKRSAEYLCSSYADEYQVPVMTARLTQTFGAGVAVDDNRVFAQFARSIIKEEDLVLHTKGESAKPYCYTTDCVAAILYILLKGEKGEAYNVANQDTYISIYDMAKFLIDTFNPKCNVIIELHPEMGYAPVTRLRLSAEKLMKLGWTPKVDLKEMFNRLIESMKSQI